MPIERKQRTNAKLVRQKMAALKLTFEEIVTRSGYGIKVIQDIASGFGATQPVLEAVAPVLGLTADALTNGVSQEPLPSPKNPITVTITITETQTKTTQYTLGDFQDQSQVSEFNERFAHALKAAYEITFKGASPGSIRVTLSMSAQDALRLLHEIQLPGLLVKQFGVEQIEFHEDSGLPADNRVFVLGRYSNETKAADQHLTELMSIVDTNADIPTLPE